VLAFGAKWCAACQADKPHKAALARRFVLVEIDADDNPGEVEKWGIESLPTYVLILNGEARWRGSDVCELERILGVQ
jgi:thioredoxin-like negative regulator of GroEL